MDKVKLTVCDWDRTTDDDILGSAEIPLAPIARDGTLVTFPHLPLAGPRAQGEINVDVSIRAYRDGFDKDLSSLQTIGFLNLRLVRVEGLCRTLRQSRPFAKFHFGEQTWVCAPAMARDDGNTWTLEATEVDLVLNEQNARHTMILDIWDADHKKASLGSAYVEIAPLVGQDQPQVRIALKERVQCDTDIDPSPTLISAPGEPEAGEAPGKVPISGTAVFEARYVPKTVLVERFWMTLAQKFDLDASGSLDPNEFALLMAGLGSNLSDEECDQLFTAADVNHDGVVSMEELSSHMGSLRAGHMSHVLRSPFSGRSLAGMTDDEIFAQLNREMSIMAAAGSDPMALAEAFMLARTYVNKITEAQPPPDSVIRVFDRNLGHPVDELIPGYIKVALRSLYRTVLGRGAAHSEKTKKMLATMTRKAGPTKNHPKSRKDIPGFVTQYNVKLEECMLPNPESYACFNDFFARKLLPGARPIDTPDDPTQMCSPADCRLMVFENIPAAQQIWVKGDNFTVDTLCGRDPALTHLLANGSFVISRLAPQDYHRIHFPVETEIRSEQDIPGTYYTVSPLAVCKNIDVYTENRRRVLRCWSPIIGEYVIVMVGATMVGSCIRTAELNTRYHKGDEIGYFAFGGSTTLLLFPPGVITLDADLVQNSAKPMESLVRMGMHIGAAGPRAPGAAAPAATATAAPATPATAAAPAAPAPAPAEPLPATAAAVAGLPSPPPVATA
eukprot:GAFH01000799.1.p1 GENE.GAFH01000799.1~~GAFH01000799.1.p1  ORF type:complete len:795 (-),score=259.69 GAFH01000799.1:512-2695(-)